MSIRFWVCRRVLSWTQCSMDTKWQMYRSYSNGFATFLELIFKCTHKWNVWRLNMFYIPREMKYLFSLNSPYSQVKVINFLLYNNLPLTVHQLCHLHFYRCTSETHNELFTVYYWIWEPQTNPGFEASTNLIPVLAFSKLISCVTLLSHLLIPVHIFPTCKKHVCLMYIKKHAWSIEMAHWVKLLAYKPDNLSLIPKGIRTNSTKLSSDLIHTPLNHLKFKTIIPGIGTVSFLPLTVL